MFDWNLNAPLIGGTVNVGCKQTAGGWNCNHRPVYREVVEALDLYLYWI